MNCMIHDLYCQDNRISVLLWLRWGYYCLVVKNIIWWHNVWNKRKLYMIFCIFQMTSSNYQALIISGVMHLKSCPYLS